MDVPKLRKHNLSGKRRSPWLACNAPQYAGLYCNINNDETLLYDNEVSNIVLRDNYFLSSIDPDAAGSSSATRYLIKNYYFSTSGLMENIHPYAFSAKVQTHTSDNPTYRDIVKLPEEARKLWDVAMVKALKSLRNLGSIQMVSRPRGVNILASTWAFRKKRYPDGALKKFKARFCVTRGQTIDGMDVFETFAPVMGWITVRLLLILSIVLQLETQQVDYTNAFFQAPLD